jgi:hypothetical protein
MDAFSQSVANLQEMILFLAPGLIFILLFFYQIPGKRKDDFTTIFLSVIFSLLIDSLALGVTQLISTTWHISLQGRYSFWLAVTLSILLAVVAARIVQSTVFRRLSKAIFKIDAEPFGRVWNGFFNIQRNTVLRVYLTDGTCYIGKLDKASMDPDDDIQEFTLTDPYYFRIKKGRAIATRITETSSILLQASTIRSIEKINNIEAKKLYQLSPK